MKRVILLLVVFAVGVGSGAFAYRWRAIDRERARVAAEVAKGYGLSGAYLARRDAFARIGATGKGRVVFVGDSLVDYWRDYPDLWTSAFGDLDAVNFGVGGECAGNVLARVKADGFHSLSPRVVVLLVGTNDLWVRPADQVAADVLDVAAAIRERGASVVVCGLVPRTGEVGRKVAEVNRLLAAGKGYVFVDTAGVGTDATTDGIHLTGEGYARWGRLLRPILLELLGK